VTGPRDGPLNPGRWLDLWLEGWREVSVTLFRALALLDDDPHNLAAAAAICGEAERVDGYWFDWFPCPSERLLDCARAVFGGAWMLAAAILVGDDEKAAELRQGLAHLRSNFDHECERALATMN
jgi:hypothetical protein